MDTGTGSTENSYLALNGTDESALVGWVPAPVYTDIGSTAHSYLALDGTDESGLVG